MEPPLSTRKSYSIHSRRVRERLGGGDISTSARAYKHWLVRIYQKLFLPAWSSSQGASTALYRMTSGLFYYS
jgi:hypothetical protein